MWKTFKYVWRARTSPGLRPPSPKGEGSATRVAIWRHCWRSLCSLAPLSYAGRDWATSVAI